MADFSNKNEKKQSTRLQNIEAVISNSLLFSKKYQKLFHDWMELSGAEAPTYSLLMKKNMLGECGITNSKFIGIDWQENKKPKSLNYCLLLDEDINVLLQSNNETLENVGILNYDSMDDWKTIVDYYFDMLLKFARNQAKKIGSFYLIINGCLRPTSEKAAKHLIYEIFNKNNISIDESCFKQYRGEGYKTTMLQVSIQI